MALEASQLVVYLWMYLKAYLKISASMLYII